MPAPYKWRYDEYRPFSRMLAARYTLAELVREYNKLTANRAKLSGAHLSAIDKTAGMLSNSQRRAQSRNAMTGNYEQAQLYADAIAIYSHYPEYCKENQPN